MFPQLVKKFSTLYEPNVHYRVQNSPSLLSFLSLINPVYAPPSCPSKILFNIIISYKQYNSFNTAEDMLSF